VSHIDLSGTQVSSRALARITQALEKGCWPVAVPETMHSTATEYGLRSSKRAGCVDPESQLEVFNLSGSSSVTDMSWDRLSKALTMSINGNVRPRHPKLVEVRLRCCRLSDTMALVKSLVAAAPLLEALDVSYNELGDSIPEEIGSLTHLRHLDLSSNQLTGPLPEQLKRLRHLHQLLLWRNRLQGASAFLCFGAERCFSLMRYVDTCTGPIEPHIFEAMEDLEELWLSVRYMLRPSG